MRPLNNICAGSVVLTSNCDQKCCFCVRDEDVQDYTLDAIRRMLLTLRKDGVEYLVLTGGEPSSRTDLVDLLNYSAELGFSRIQVQTNGAIADYQDVIRVLSEMTSICRVEVTVSLHSSFANTHDELVNRKGSWSRAISAIDTCSQAGIHVATNAVITARNTSNLFEIAELSKSHNCHHVQLSLMHISDLSTSNLKPRLTEALKEARTTVSKFEQRFVQVEGFPVCLLRDMEYSCSELYWPGLIKTFKVSSGNTIDYYQTEFGRQRFWPDSCSSCGISRVCPGVWREYSNEFEVIRTK